MELLDYDSDEEKKGFLEGRTCAMSIRSTRSSMSASSHPQTEHSTPKKELELADDVYEPPKTNKKPTITVVPQHQVQPLPFYNSVNKNYTAMKESLRNMQVQQKLPSLKTRKSSLKHPSKHLI